LKRDFVEEGDFVASTPSSKKYGRLKPIVVIASSSAAPPPPVITTTSLMVLRLCGKYLRVMQMLQTISEDVFNAVTQLVEYYFINVYHMFASDLKSESHHTVPSYKLTSLVQRVNQSMIKAKPLPNSESGISLNKTSINNFLNDLNKSNSSTAAVANNSVAAEVNDDNIATGSSDGHTCMNLEMAELNPSVDLNCPETLHGFRERYIAAESLTYIVSQLKSLKQYMTKAMSLEGAAIVEDYLTQNLDLFCEIRQPLYLSVAQQSVNCGNTLRQMAKVGWDIKEVQSQHNQYVDNMLRELQVFSMRLQEIELTLLKESLDSFWEMASFATALIFVEGFSEAKRCSNEGRALMQLDYRQFAMKLEAICGIKPLPHQELVTHYVKAFYIPEAELENWVKYHTEYSPKQLIALVSSVAYSNNKTKQKLNSLINEFSGKIRKTQ